MDSYWWAHKEEGKASNKTFFDGNNKEILRSLGIKGGEKKSTYQLHECVSTCSWLVAMLIVNLHVQLDPIRN